MHVCIYLCNSLIKVNTQLMKQNVCDINARLIVIAKHPQVRLLRIHEYVL